MKWGKTLETQWVPFDKDGNQEEYSYSWDDTPTPEEVGKVWRHNEVFADTLKYAGYRHGRAGGHFVFVRVSTRKNVHMFRTDFDDIVPKMVSGMLGGMFTFCKRGSNYGIKLVSSVKVDV